MDPIILISHHMGIAFPHQQWALLQAKWSNRIQIIFGAICSLEALQGCHCKEPAVCPPSLVHQLEELAEDIEALGVLYSCFESWEVPVRCVWEGVCAHVCMHTNRHGCSWSGCARSGVITMVCGTTHTLRLTTP